MEKSDFRVLELNGEFKIERKIVTQKKVGYFWNRKTINEENWYYVNKDGIALDLQYFIFYNGCLDELEIETFENLESAFKKINYFLIPKNTETPKYHYL